MCGFVICWPPQLVPPPLECCQTQYMQTQCIKTLSQDKGCKVVSLISAWNMMAKCTLLRCCCLVDCSWVTAAKTDEIVISPGNTGVLCTFSGSIVDKALKTAPDMPRFSGPVQDLIALPATSSTTSLVQGKTAVKHVSQPHL